MTATPFQFLAAVEHAIRADWEADPDNLGRDLQFARRLAPHQGRASMQIGLKTGAASEPAWFGIVEVKILPDHDGPPAFTCQLGWLELQKHAEHLILILPGALESSSQLLAAQFLAGLPPAPMRAEAV